MKDKIFTICVDLTARNIKPTLENVRKELGGGSFSTINPILKEWKESQTSKPTPSVSIPPEAIKAIEQATALVWKLATEHQTEAINAIQTEASRIEQAAIVERDEALTEVQTLEARIKELESKTTELKNANISLNTDNSAKNQFIDSLQHEGEKQQIRLDNALKTTVKAEKETGELKGTINTQNTLVNDLKLEIEKQRLTTESTANAMERQAAEIEQLKTEAKQATAEAKAQTKELNSLSLQSQKLQTALDSSNKATEKATREAKEERQKAEQAQNEAAKLAGMLEGYKLSTAKNKVVKTA